jgi:DsbC/DsbD-like thiol-disulfide interchange protein
MWSSIRLAPVEPPDKSSTMLNSRPLLFAVSMAVAAPASAGTATEWYETHGASIRVVTETVPDADGILRGALEIRLEPGWKTYWRDPGDSGVPPTITVSGNDNVADPEIGFPPPRRFDDGYSQFAGYDETVALALSFPVNDAHGELDFTADLFLGVCETICIPVQASLEIAPARMSGESEWTVAEAFARLPGEAHEGFRARIVEIHEDRLIVETTLPEGGNDAELYVAGTEQYLMGLPDRIEGNATRFAVSFFANSEAMPPARLHYTLVAGGEAVAGTLRLGE